MEYDGKEKSPYYGVWQSCLILIVVPLLFFALFYWMINKFQNYPYEMNLYSSIAFGFGVGSLFQLACVIGGMMKGTFKVVVNRVKKFLSDLSISFKFAIKYYWEDVKSEGVVFWIFFVIIVANISLAAYGIISYITNYYTLFN